MLLPSSGIVHQDTHRARIIDNALRQNKKESLQHYYSRTVRLLATQVSFGYRPDADIDQATDFTYKVDRKKISMITNLDWIKESEIRKYHVALRADSRIAQVTTYPANLAEAFQRACRRWCLNTL